MDIPVEVISLFLAAWGAILSTWLAFRGWLRGRTRIGLDIHHNFRIGDTSDSWEWLAFDVTLRNASEKPVSLVEFGLAIVRSDGTITAGYPANHAILPNGDTVFEDPDTHKRRAVDATFRCLETPVNLPPRGSVHGWIPFFLPEPVPRTDAETRPLQIVVVDHERKTWTQTYEGMGESRQFTSGRSYIIRTRN